MAELGLMEVRPDSQWAWLLTSGRRVESRDPAAGTRSVGAVRPDPA